MRTEISNEKPYWIALIGFILCIPAFYLITTGILFSLSGLNLIDPVQNTIGFILHPVVILGGLGLAFMINLFAVVRPSLHSDQSSLVKPIFYKDRIRNPLIICICLALLAAILLYGIVENYEIIPR